MRIDRNLLLKFSWAPTIRGYTRHDTTESSDKLVAFSGIANVIAQRTDQQYYAGIFAGNLAKNLFWCSAVGQLIRPQIKERALSRSCASWDGEICFWDGKEEVENDMFPIIRTGHPASMKSAVYKELDAPIGSARGITRAMLELTAMSLPLTRLEFPVGVLENRGYWRDQNVNILPDFWPYGYKQWVAD